MFHEQEYQFTRHFSPARTPPRRAASPFVPSQSPDPRDIESLVGPITPQCLEILASVQAPPHDSPTS